MRGLLASVGVCVLLATGVARADGDEELARRHFLTGQLLYDRAKYGEALHEFEAARAVLHRPPFDYNIGLCLEYLGRWDEAADAFARFADGAVSESDAIAAWKRVATLRERRPKVGTAPPITAAARALRLVGGLGAGVGGGLLIAAIPTGLSALRARDDYRSGCVTTCDPALYESGRRFAVTTDALIGVGVGLAVVGVTLVGVSYHRAAATMRQADAARPF